MADPAPAVRIGTSGWSYPQGRGTWNGVFYPVAHLPVVVQVVAWVTPLWHGVELCRALALGAPLGVMHVAHLGVLLAFVVGGWVAARHTFTRRLLA